MKKPRILFIRPYLDGYTSYSDYKGGQRADFVETGPCYYRIVETRDRLEKVFESKFFSTQDAKKHIKNKFKKPYIIRNIYK